MWRLAPRIVPRLAAARTPSRLLMARSIGLLGSSSCCTCALSEPRAEHGPEAGALSIKEVTVGDGTAASVGMWVTLHYAVRLVGDGAIVEDTRTSGCGDRTYGEPLRFELGDLGDAAVLRALHVAVLDMRVGGARRLRTTLLEPHFGYRYPPPLVERNAEGRKVVRSMHGDWLIDVTVELLAVDDARPLPLWRQQLERVRAAVSG